MITGACLYHFNATRYLGSTYVCYNDSAWKPNPHLVPPSSTGSVHLHPPLLSPQVLHLSIRLTPASWLLLTHLNGPLPPAHLCLPVGNSCSTRGHPTSLHSELCSWGKDGSVLPEARPATKGAGVWGEPLHWQHSLLHPSNLSQVSCQGTASLFNTFLRSLIGFL